MKDRYINAKVKKVKGFLYLFAFDTKTKKQVVAEIGDTEGAMEFVYLENTDLENRKADSFL